ncbi:MAG: hypothetical protein AABW64_03125, partial [Nanoarchaeota archaeon]
VAIGSATLTSLVIDHTPPAVTVEILDSITKKSKTLVEFGDKVIIRCVRSDPTAGFNDTNISSQTPRSTAYSLTTLSAETGTASKDLDFTFADTKELGFYNFLCSVRDRTGLVNATANATFEVISKPPSGGSPFQDPNFKPPIATIIIGAGTTSDLGTLNEVGTSRLIAKTGAVRIDLNAEQHTFTLKDYAGDAPPYTATFTVDGSFDISLSSGETKSVDLTADGVDDISIELHNIFSKKADTTFKLLPVQQQPPQEPVQPSVPTVVPQQPPQKIEGSSWLFVILSIIAMVLIIFVALHYFAGRQRRGGMAQQSGKPPVAFNRKDLGAYRQEGTASLNGTRQNSDNYRQL